MHTWSANEQTECAKAPHVVVGRFCARTKLPSRSSPCCHRCLKDNGADIKCPCLFSCARHGSYVGGGSPLRAARRGTASPGKGVQGRIRRKPTDKSRARRTETGYKAGAAGQGSNGSRHPILVRRRALVNPAGTVRRVRSLPGDPREGRADPGCRFGDEAGGFSKERLSHQPIGCPVILKIEACQEVRRQRDLQGLAP